MLVLTIVALCLLWEGYKWMGEQTDDHWPGTDLGLPVRTDDLTMPHAGDIVAELGDDVRDGRTTLPLWEFLLRRAAFTLQEAALGFAAGLVIGMALAVVMLRWKVAERGLMPWLAVSQTVPLIALAPIVVTWGRQQGMSQFQSVAVISTFLTFFPIAVGGLRGLQSPAAADVELMRSYAASWTRTLVTLRLPASRPYLFPAMRLAATLAVVGAVVGEISSAERGGIGRAILEFAQRYSTGPERLYAAVLGAAVLGLVAYTFVGILERVALRHQRSER